MANVKRGRMTTNANEVDKGWHGGMTRAESDVPLIFSNSHITAFEDDNVIKNAVDSVIQGSTKPRTVHLASIVHELFNLTR